MSATKAFFAALIEDWFESGQRALKSIEPDLCVLGTFPMNIHSVLCSQVLKIPYCQIHLVPIVATSEHAPPVGYGDGQTSFNFMARIKWNLFFKIGYKLLYASTLSRLYKPLGVSISHSKVMTEWAGAPAVLGYSTTLSPRPSDYDETKVKIVGAILEGHSDEDVARFLETEDGRRIAEHLGAASKPFVYVGFGSMWDMLTKREKQRVLGEIIESTKVLKDVGRFIIQIDEESADEARKSNTFDSSDSILISKAPHSWLFPKMDVVVCHGGSGTTHRAILHCCATVVCPCKADSDQPFWAGCVERAKLGVRGPNMRNLSAARLAECVRQSLSPSVKAAVKTASEEMKKQDGARDGAKVILRDFSQ
mmetsp:Transcript_25507/g.57204  ORF Transcript_25507/g.57204 Transcript_25507/m.57204 type:complete len:365 (-) Transcript_25507:106-1200(-)